MTTKATKITSGNCRNPAAPDTHVTSGDAGVTRWWSAYRARTSGSPNPANGRGTANTTIREMWAAR